MPEVIATSRLSRKLAPCIRVTCALFVAPAPRARRLPVPPRRLATLGGRMLSRLSVSLVAALALALVPAPGFAQVSLLEGLFKDVTHVGGTHSCWDLDARSVISDGCRLDSGFGIRITKTFDLLWIDQGPPTAGTPTGVTITKSPSGDTLQVEEQYEPSAARQKRWRFAEMGLELGYSQFSGFKVDPAAAPLTDVSGDLRELPSFSGYFRPHMVYWFSSGNPVLDELNPVGMFGVVGVHTGLVTAANFSAALPADTSQASRTLARDEGGAAVPQAESFTASGQAFQYGISGGLGARVGNFSVAWEYGYMSRRMHLTWKGVSGVSSIPDALPKLLDGSGWSGIWSFRWQIVDPFGL